MRRLGYRTEWNDEIVFIRNKKTCTWIIIPMKLDELLLTRTFPPSNSAPQTPPHRHHHVSSQ